MGLLRLSFGIKALDCWMLPGSDVVDKAIGELLPSAKQ